MKALQSGRIKTRMLVRLCRLIHSRDDRTNTVPQDICCSLLLSMNCTIRNQHFPDSPFVYMLLCELATSWYEHN